MKLREFLKTKMIKAVIFDYGGVVKQMSDAFIRNVAKSFNIDEEEFLEVYRKPLSPLLRGTMSEENFWKNCSSQLNLPDNFKQLYKGIYKKFFHIFSEIIDLVEELKKKGIITAVLSNVSRMHADMIREYKGYEFFDVVILSCEVGIVKPEKEIYQLTLDKLGIKGEEAIFIDDREENLVPARELGIKTVLAQSSEQIIREVNTLLI